MNYLVPNNKYKIKRIRKVFTYTIAVIVILAILLSFIF